MKSQIGCGTPIIVNFYASMVKDRHETSINYDFKQFGDDLDLLKLENKEKYCLKQVYKMCYYIQKLYHIEIIRMKVEFSQDDNNTIWMQHASDICT